MTEVDPEDMEFFTDFLSEPFSYDMINPFKRIRSFFRKRKYRKEVWKTAVHTNNMIYFGVTK